MSQSRQLAAIMFTDIVGYTAMMQKNESEALSKVDRYKQVQNEIIHKYDGNILNYYGDGSLTVFKSVLSAVECAMVLQQSLLKSPKVPIRIGIHTGDVLYRDGEAYGDGINIASRLQAFGDSGSIIISGDVYDKIKNHPELKSVHLGKHRFKNILSRIDVHAMSNSGLKIPKGSTITSTNSNDQDSGRVFNRKFRSSIYYVLISIFLVALVVFIVFKIRQREEIQFAKNSTLPALSNQLNQIQDIGGKGNWELYFKYLKLKKDIRNRPEFIQLWHAITSPLSIYTNHSGGKVYAKPYSNPDTSWFYLGKTPLINYPFPRGLSRIKIEDPNYQTQYDIILKYFNQYFKGDTLHYQLFRKSEIPENMVFVPGRMGDYRITPTLPPVYIGDFWMDRYEVTNAEFKTFMESGGYDNESYWSYPFTDGEDTISFDVAIGKFIDKTGWPGPSNWELSDFPKGEGELPVTGVSWYEAAAFATFKNKQLPTLFHWKYVSEPHGAPEIVKFGNFNKKGPVKGATYNSLTRYGTYDLPGNVSEWVFNSNLSKRFVMGGNYEEPSYLYNSTYIQITPWSRTELVGFRCIKYSKDTSQTPLKQNFDQVKRDYNNLTPVPNEIFQVYKGLLEVEKTALNPVSISKSKSEYWIKEIVEVKVPYEDAPMKILIFLPSNYKTPHQTILYFPGIDSHYSNDVADIKVDDRIDFFLKSGRAVIWPVYYASHGRGAINMTNVNSWKQTYRYIITDVKITMDYLQTRKDIDFERIAYYGFSWGGGVAPFILAVEDRIKIGVLSLFGVSSVAKYRFKEFDQVDYLPHVNIPMLLLGGRYDFDYTLEQQQAFYDLLGTSKDEKKWMIYESTHYVPRSNLVNESLDWLDNYFGEVEKIDL